MLHLILLAALIDPTLIPSIGSITKDFVPAGWHIVQEVEGELTGAGKPEVVVQLVENGPSGSPHGAMALLILGRTTDGKLARLAVSPNQALGVRIARGVLILSTFEGLQRFRYDPASRQFLLIGEDTSVQEDDGSRRTSTNFLTGAQIVETWMYSEKARADVVMSSEKKTVEKTRRSIEEVQFPVSTAQIVPVVYRPTAAVARRALVLAQSVTRLTDPDAALKALADYPLQTYWRDQPFRVAYRRALRAAPQESWVAELSVVISPVNLANIAGRTLVIWSACEAHNCGGTYLFIVYDPKSHDVFAIDNTDDPKWQAFGAGDTDMQAMAAIAYALAAGDGSFDSQLPLNDAQRKVVETVLGPLAQ